MITTNRIRLAPRKFEPEQLEENLAGQLFSVYDTPTAEVEPKLMKTVREFTRRLAQLDALSGKKPQATRQSTDNGTDEVSNERKPRQRPASRCWNSADVRVQRVTILTLRTDFKRLIPYSKQAKRLWG